MVQIVGGNDTVLGEPEIEETQVSDAGRERICCGLDFHGRHCVFGERVLGKREKMS